ncbi:MAG: carotenoid oxygenase family protein [Caulobacteraceae bacterium]
MTTERQAPLLATLRPSDHPYLSGAWTPRHEEVDAEQLTVLEGAIPPEIDGVYLRNSENPLHQPLGRYHPFDGDGMIAAVRFEGGRASYRNRFIRTDCLMAEQEAGGSLWGGLADPPGVSRRPGFGAHGSLKDSASTDVVVHAGVGIATFYQCGAAWRFDPLTLETLGPADWAPSDGVSAHAKVDPGTGELLFFNYSKAAPYLHFGVVGPDQRLRDYRPVPLPGPRLPHDMAFTPHWAILNDMPMFWDAELLKRDIHAIRLHEGIPSRFALVPRGGGETRWFEAAPTYVLHWLNAFEDGGEVVLDGYFQEQPTPPPLAGAPPGLAAMMAYLDAHSFRPKLHRWRFDLATGATREERLTDDILEFGVINPVRAGRPYRYGWSMLMTPGRFLFEGFAKTDLVTRETVEHRLAPGRYASEAPFIPRSGGRAEDNGWLVSLITDEDTGTSECLLLDAADIAAPPVCRLALPHKVPSGTHACWAEARELR